MLSNEYNVRLKYKFESANVAQNPFMLALYCYKDLPKQLVSEVAHQRSWAFLGRK